MQRDTSLVSTPSLAGGVRAFARLRAFVRGSPIGAVGGAIGLIMLLTAILAPVIAPQDPYRINYDRLFAPPGARFLLGSDEFGRDVLSRVIYGARISLYVAVLAVALGQAGGAVFGIISGYFGGRTDMLIQRVMDTFMSLPALVLALAIVAALGPSVNNVVLAIGIVQVPRAARDMRSAALMVRANQYVEAARAVGCTHGRVLLQHVLPNCTAPFIIIATAALGIAILTEGSLSFLGLGTPPPTPSWGSMLSGAGLQYAEKAPWLGVFPGLAMTMAVFGFNLLGDALRDAFDPRMRQR